MDRLDVPLKMVVIYELGVQALFVGTIELLDLFVDRVNMPLQVIHPLKRLGAFFALIFLSLIHI